MEVGAEAKGPLKGFARGPACRFGGRSDWGKSPRLGPARFCSMQILTTARREERFAAAKRALPGAYKNRITLGWISVVCVEIAPMFDFPMFSSFFHSASDFSHFRNFPPIFRTMFKLWENLKTEPWKGTPPAPPIQIISQFAKISPPGRARHLQSVCKAL